jgi:hypothetical protein
MAEDFLPVGQLMMMMMMMRGMDTKEEMSFP